MAANRLLDHDLALPAGRSRSIAAAPPELIIALMRTALNRGWPTRLPRAWSAAATGRRFRSRPKRRSSTASPLPLLLRRACGVRNSPPCARICVQHQSLSACTPDRFAIRASKTLLAFRIKFKTSETEHAQYRNPGSAVHKRISKFQSIPPSDQDPGARPWHGCPPFAAVNLQQSRSDYRECAG